MRPQKIGKNRRVLTLLNIPESSVDTFGQPSQAQVELVAAVHTEVRPLRGEELVDARQIWATATHMIKCRWLGSLIPTSPDNPNGWIVAHMVLKDTLGSTFYHIEFAENVEMRNRQWILTCTEKVGAVA